MSELTYEEQAIGLVLSLRGWDPKRATRVLNDRRKGKSVRIPYLKRNVMLVLWLMADLDGEHFPAADSLVASITADSWQRSLDDVCKSKHLNVQLAEKAVDRFKEIVGLS